MPISLSIKDVPDAWAERLRERAARNHRSLQRELMALVEAAVTSAPAAELFGTPAALRLASPMAVYDAPRVACASTSQASSGLLAELDAIVVGSRWGEAPVLTREQANDRRLAREVEYDAQQSLAESASQPSVPHD